MTPETTPSTTPNGDGAKHGTAPASVPVRAADAVLPVKSDGTKTTAS
jgi:hypothetical protein